MRAPRFLRLGSEPGPLLAEVARSGKGYEILLLWLILEYALIAPDRLAVHLATFRVDALGALASLNSSFVSLAAKPALAVCGLGLVLSFALRRRERSLSLWGAISMVAYAWLPHVLLVAASVLLAAAGLDHPVMPHHRFREASGLWVPLKLALEFAPSAVLVTLGVNAMQKEPRDPIPLGTSTWALGALAVVLLGGASVVHARAVQRNWATLRPVMPADPVPTFAIRSLDGGTVVREGALLGQVTLIDFWATWCPPCVAALPHLAELHRDLTPMGLGFLSVNVEPENREGVQTFVQEKGLPFPVYVDQGAMQRQFKIHTYPTAVLVDHAGKVRHVFVGTTSMVTIRQAAEALLRERGSAKTVELGARP